MTLPARAATQITRRLWRDLERRPTLDSAARSCIGATAGANALLDCMAAAASARASPPRQGGRAAQSDGPRLGFTRSRCRASRPGPRAVIGHAASRGRFAQVAEVDPLLADDRVDDRTDTDAADRRTARPVLTSRRARLTLLVGLLAVFSALLALGQVARADQHAKPAPPSARAAAQALLDQFKGQRLDRVRYDWARGCTHGAQRGTIALQRLLKRVAPRGESMGIFNCRMTRGGSNYSLHAEGRALDWHLNIHNRADREQAQRTITMLLGSDSKGRKRRAGPPHRRAGDHLGLPHLLGALDAVEALRAVPTSAGACRTRSRTATTCTSASTGSAPASAPASGATSTRLQWRSVRSGLRCKQH